MQTSLALTHHSLPFNGDRKMRSILYAVWLPLITLVASSSTTAFEQLTPPSGPPNPVLRPETVATIKIVTESIGIPGAIVAFTSPRGDAVLTFGNRTVDGDPVTPQVSGYRTQRSS
jgi:hypothetical protein